MGYCQLGDESNWRSRNTKSILDAAKGAGIHVMYEEAMQKQDNQIKAIRSFISYQVDIIAFSPIVESGWDDVLKEANEAKIPVVILDRNINVKNEDLYTCFIGSDFIQEGIYAGEYALEKYKEQTDPVYIVELKGTDNSTPAIGRTRGFMNIIQGDQKFQIVQSISGDFMLSRGKEIIRERLERYGAEQMDLLYSHNDEMTQGAIEELREYGLMPGVDVAIISVDAGQEMINYLKMGMINCSIECNPNSGQLLVDSVKKILNGGKVDKIIYLEEEVFTEFDDLSAIEPRDY